MKYKFWKNMEIDIFTLLLIISFLVTAISSAYFAFMSHNIDLSYNTLLMINDLNNFNAKLNSSVVFDYRLMADKPTLTSTVNISDSYIKNTNSLRFFVVVIGLGMYVFGYSGMWLYLQSKGSLK